MDRRERLLERQLELDLLHNFFLECGARASKIRVYEMVNDLTARECVGAGEVWNGAHPEDGSELGVVVDIPEGFDVPDLEAEPQLTAPIGPDIDPELFQDVATRISPELKPKKPMRRSRSPR